MKKCAICGASVDSFFSKPTFGAGKLKDGNELCLQCFNKISKKNGSNFKNTTLEQALACLKDLNKDSEKLEEIKNKIKSLGIDNYSSFLGRKEINKLPEILQLGEELENIAQGSYNNNQGILIATNRRLVFIDAGLVMGARVEDFNYEKITSIQHETGIMTGKIKIMCSGNNAVIDNVFNDQVTNFSNFIREKIYNTNKNIQQPTIIQQNALDIADQIEKLASLKEKGILTNEEFQEQKKKLLGL